MAQNYCSSCGSPIPEGQGRSCSMCYGDVNYGRDGYYEIPNSVKEMFEQGENSYRIIDYSIEEMDNIQSMQHFLDCIGATSENIDIDDGTQVVVKHPDFDHKLVIASGGLGDFYSHGYDVTLLEAGQ
jgi:primosomal protein N'